MTQHRYFLPDLKYSYDALEPIISKQIMELHHKKHHNGYVEKSNLALTKIEDIRAGKTDDNLKNIYKDLAFNLNGHFLHSIFWQNMKRASESNLPSKDFHDVLNKNFGSFDSFREEFKKMAESVEGSGWAILAKVDKDVLMIEQIEKHNLNHIVSLKPLLVLDVWEHAYYLDYENKRGEYIDNWWQVVNWLDVETRFNS
jgi:Fe-Mn family superoxide dismutase